MAPQLGNYVLETATAPGTGSFTLNGPETARRSFSAAFPNGGTVFYFADDGSSAEWGVGTLTIGTPSTLSRTTIIGTTSGSASALNFSGSVEVYNEIPAEYVPILEADGHLIVKSITDWTQRQALGAADAEGRYIKSVNDSTNIRVDGAGINKQTGVPWLHTGSGFTNLQAAGDYATNAAVNTEVTARVNAVAGLDAAKVNRAGDTMRGALSTFNDPNLTNGVYNYSPAFRTYTNSRAGFQFFAQDKVGDGSTASGVLVQEWNGVAQQYWWFNPDGGIGQSSKGDVAFVSQIPTDYVTNGTFQNSLPFVDKNLRAQVFTKVVGNGVWVTIPQAFKTLVGVLALQFSSGSEGVRPLRVETNGATGGQFQMSEWDTGGNTQYTFLVFGYF
ncbi:tail fiber protein [Acetobacter senegalensis]|uniref:Tail fiber protein n=1 Tax=Acetobacter senegalensis TaxID=446692 RepID=A0A0U5ESK4_9PROT|nr:hypothetical protein [Acetobacter senegalensis]CEF40796.1 tail fiber protein [Acetobacter senegalensis]